MENKLYEVSRSESLNKTNKATKFTDTTKGEINPGVRQMLREKADGDSFTAMEIAHVKTTMNNIKRNDRRIKNECIKGSEGASEEGEGGSTSQEGAGIH